MKIISFSQQGSRAICILAANGSISNVTLRQQNSSGGTLTYEVGTSPIMEFDVILHINTYIFSCHNLLQEKVLHFHAFHLQGRFEILSLTGSFMPSDNGLTKSRSGGMSVSLAGHDGRVLGGGLAGMLVAAGPVQVRQFQKKKSVF